MTFAQLKSHVTMAMADLAHSAAGMRGVTDQLAGDWINAAVQKVDAELRWSRARSTFNTVIGTRWYTLDTNIREIVDVTYGADLLVRITNEEDIIKHDADTTTGTPRNWAWWGAEIGLYPTPAAVAAVTMYTVRAPTLLVGPTEVPTLPTHMHTLLVDDALVQAFRHAGEVEKMMVLRDKFRQDLAAESDRLYNDRGTNDRVRRDGI